MLTCPIGKALPGEKPEDAMKREVMEELGFTPRGYRFLGVFQNKVSYLPSPIPVHIFELQGEPEYKNLEPEKCDFVGWMSPREIMKSGKKLSGPLEHYLREEKLFSLIPTQEELSVTGSPYYKDWGEMTFKEQLKTNYLGYRPLKPGINKNDVPKEERKKEKRRNALRMSSPYYNYKSGAY